MADESLESIPRPSPSVAPNPFEHSFQDGSDTLSARGRHRPNPESRKASGTMIIPHDQDEEGSTPMEVYGPDDARAMSPRRTAEEADKLGENTRLAVTEHARRTQLSLLEIAESIELVKADHDKLERQNVALQDYIGGLTRSMSKNEIGAEKSKSKSKGKK